MADKITTILDMDLTSGITTATSSGPSAPGTPGALTLAAGSPAYTVITLSWSAGNDGNSAITGYRIKKDGSILVANTSSTATTYSATGLTHSTSYSFEVAAINAYGTGPDGNTPSLTTSAYTVPAAPGTLSLAANGASASTAVDLTWSTPASDGGQTISGYRVQKSTNGSSWSDVTATTGSSATTYTATGLTQNTQYWFRVAAINSIGTGADSNEPNITTANVMSWTATGTYTTGTDGSNTWVKWTSTGNFVVSNVAATVDIFVSAGGGSGAKAGGVYYGPYGGAGGGGGGGALTTTGVTVGVGTHVATVGDGAASPGTSIGVNGSRGNNSMFAVSGGSTYTGQGGGHGSTNGAGESAGCGGGGGGLSTSTHGAGGTGSQGGDGGESQDSGNNYHFGGGGGGMGGNGGHGSGTSWTAGAGGTDQTNSYTGSAIAYGGGGGGQASGFSSGAAGGTTGTAGAVSQSNVSAPAANSSGGSGAGSLYTNGAGGPFSGAAGGSGVVVIRFPTP